MDLCLRDLDANSFRGSSTFFSSECSRTAGRPQGSDCLMVFSFDYKHAHAIF